MVLKVTITYSKQIIIVAEALKKDMIHFRLSHKF